MSSGGGRGAALGRTVGGGGVDGSAAVACLSKRWTTRFIAIRRDGMFDDVHRQRFNRPSRSVKRTSPRCGCLAGSGGVPRPGSRPFAAIRWPWPRWGSSSSGSGKPEISMALNGALSGLVDARTHSQLLICPRIAVRLGTTSPTSSAEAKSAIPGLSLYESRPSSHSP